MINLAQLGVGYWGPNLLRNAMENKRCKVTTVADLDPQRRAYVQTLYPAVKVEERVEEVLEDPDINGVIIATPVSTHFDLAVKALKRGKHILVEKPLATTCEEIDIIGRIAAEKKLVAMAGHTFLYNPAVQFVKKVIDSGEIGDVRYIYSQRLNLGRIRDDVDAMWNLAPHDVSIIQYWLSDPDPISVFKRGVDCIQENIADVVFLNIQYPNRVMANIHVSWLDPQKVRLMTIVGTKKMLVYDDIADIKIAIYDKGIDAVLLENGKGGGNGREKRLFKYRSGDVLYPKIDFQEPLKLEIGHFIDCIQDGRKCLTGVDHARKVVEILSQCDKG